MEMTTWQPRQYIIEEEWFETVINKFTITWSTYTRINETKGRVTYMPQRDRPSVFPCIDMQCRGHGTMSCQTREQKTTKVENKYNRCPLYGGSFGALYSGERVFRQFQIWTNDMKLILDINHNWIIFYIPGHGTLFTKCRQMFCCCRCCCFFCCCCFKAMCYWKEILQDQIDIVEFFTENITFQK